MSSNRQLIDWSLAARFGRAVAGSGPRIDPSEARAVAEDFRKHVDVADRLVRDYTGLSPLGPPGTSAVLSRASWVDANVRAVRSMLEPVTERFEARLGRSGMRAVGSRLMALQIGSLLGYISQKVLGQYDLLLATGEAGRVYFVGPNIVGAERRHGLEPHDFRLWIALHEVTHRTQFLSVPWLQQRVESYVAQYLEGVTLDAGRIRELSRRLGDTLAAGPDAWRRANVVSLFLTDEQRDAVDRMQSLMSVVEGHGNFVMDGVAQAEIPTYRRLREALHERRSSAGAAERALQRFIALDLKYEQYAVGQAFFDEVERMGGMSAVNAVWESPDNLPTAGELRDPEAWVRRVAPQPRLFD